MIIIYILLLSFVYADIHSRCPEHIEREQRPDLDFHYESPSGDFLIHYDTLGDNAPDYAGSNSFSTILDYVQSVAIAADSAKYILTGLMGYNPEESDSDGIYDIYIVLLSSSLWGVHYPDSEQGGSFIKIKNSYEDINDDEPLSEYCDNTKDRLWLTIGHEYFHAIQHAYNDNAISYFEEFTSMWFENIFVPSCYDFVGFAGSPDSPSENNSNTLFQNPTGLFYLTTHYSYGYSLSLYGHYLSTIIDTKGAEDQTNSTIIREIWENYPDGGNVFYSLKDVLENNYSTSFPETWIDFMSSNMFCGEYEDMNNDIYYNLGQALINPPLIDYHSIDSDATIYEAGITLGKDSLSIVGYEPAQHIEVISTISSFPSDGIAWFGNVSDENTREEISGSNTNEISSTNSPDRFFFLFTSLDESSTFNLTHEINIYGCTDIEATNFNSEAIYDDGTCTYIDKLISIFPNPINLNSTSLNITFSQSLASSSVLVEIINIKGELAADKTFITINTGEQSVKLDDFQSLSSGIYLLRFSSNDYTETIAFTNVK